MHPSGSRCSSCKYSGARHVSMCPMCKNVQNVVALHGQTTEPDVTLLVWYTYGRIHERLRTGAA